MSRKAQLRELQQIKKQRREAAADPEYQPEAAEGADDPEVLRKDDEEKVVCANAAVLIMRYSKLYGASYSSQVAVLMQVRRCHALVYTLDGWHIPDLAGFPAAGGGHQTSHQHPLLLSRVWRSAHSHACHCC